MPNNILEKPLIQDRVLIDQNELLKPVMKILEKKESSILQILSEELSIDLINFITKYSDLDDDSSIAIKTSTAFNVDQLPKSQNSVGDYSTLINLKAINDTLQINQLFKSFNQKLSTGGLIVGCAETYHLRKTRLLKKYPPVLNWIYYTFDYMFKRVFPKLPFFDKIYFYIAAGRNRAISVTETLGRLNYCGFRVVDKIHDNGLLYFVAKKVEEPGDVKEKSYRIILNLPRKGKSGKTIHVYKLRSMFPYAEYIQQYMYEQNKLQEGGKFKNDFRISMVGRFFRKYFLDELPMLFNLIKGDLKLVGVRPISQQYFNLYSKELQIKRLKYKPGLIPPYYADLPKTMEEIQSSEMRYLEACDKNKYLTDFKYFFMAMRNIVFRSARSK
jgi:lipopolysaccharide/colanic/teichoic acid biosynthesis glycosyltransferase